VQDNGVQREGRKIISEDNNCKINLAGGKFQVAISIALRKYGRRRTLNV
jgi:hypothetical protein